MTTLSHESPLQMEALLKILEQANRNFAQNPSTSLSQAEEVIEAALKLNDQVLYAKALIIKGTSLSFLAQYTNAVRALEEALKLGFSLNNDSIVLNALYHHGNLYTKIGDLQQALSKYTEALTFSKKISEYHTITLLNNISVIYSKLNQLEESLTILNEALSLSDRQPIDFIVFLHANIAEVHLKLDHIRQAEHHIETASSLLKGDFENVLYKVQYLKAKAKLLGIQKNWNEAMQILQEAKDCCMSTYNDYRASSILRDMSHLFYEQQLYTEAITPLKDAYDICEKINANVEMRDILLQMAKIHEKLCAFEDAYQCMKKYNQLQELIKTETLENMLLKETIAFEIERVKKEAEITNLKHEEALRRAEAESMKAQLLEENLRDIQTIVDIGQSITATLDLPTVLDLIQDHIKTIVDVTVIGIALFDPENSQLCFKLLHQDGQDVSGREIMLNDPKSYSAKCLRDRQTILEQQIVDDDVNSAIFLPLVIMNEPIGVLTLQSPSHQAFNTTIVTMLEAISAYVAIALKNSQQSEALQISSKAYEKLSQTDALTGLYNRRHMDQLLEAAYKNEDKINDHSAVAIIDIDHFKDINDTLGHPAGDAVLVHLAEFLQKELGNKAIVSRWGGEEFLLYLPNVSLNEIEHLMSNLCLSVSQEPFEYEHSTIRVTITIGAMHRSILGVNTFLQRYDTKEAMIQLADKALYKGKASGRNQTKLYRVHICD